jgi:hypothetical protein
LHAGKYNRIAVKGIDPQGNEVKNETAKIQGDLFGPIDIIVPTHYEHLRERYTRIAHELVMSLLLTKGTITYDIAWRAALTFPLVWESDLKTWIATWDKDRSVVVNGLTAKERVPKLDRNHTLTFVPVGDRTAEMRTGDHNAAQRATDSGSVTKNA